MCIHGKCSGHDNSAHVCVYVCICVCVCVCGRLRLILSFAPHSANSLTLRLRPKLLNFGQFCTYQRLCRSSWFSSVHCSQVTSLNGSDWYRRPHICAIMRCGERQGDQDLERPHSRSLKLKLVLRFQSFMPWGQGGRH